MWQGFFECHHLHIFEALTRKGGSASVACAIKEKSQPRFQEAAYSP